MGSKASKVPLTAQPRARGGAQAGEHGKTLVESLGW